VGQYQRSFQKANNLKTKLNNGPYLAKVISHLDPTLMGSLEVMLYRDTPNIGYTNGIPDTSQTVIARCAMPFYGYSLPANAQINDADSISGAQTSYGMWFVPPDIGVTVLVIFVEGDPDQCYWIGCVPAFGANHMVPAIASSDKLSLTSKSSIKPNSGNLPATDPRIPNKPSAQSNSINTPQTSLDKQLRPVHPFAKQIAEQGLIEDFVRGVTTSSARREAPSSVFGISTPGPFDHTSEKFSFQLDSSGKTFTLPKSRLGGTQFVMDDGNPKKNRKGPAGTTKMEYVDSPAGERNIPESEYVRFRTRTGHQILLHNSEDLIYIGNARGTTWIEMTSNGKIDIYAQDSISIHTEQDLNFRAGRDVNIEAGQNINLKSHAGGANFDIGTDFNTNVRGNMYTTTSLDYNVSSKQRMLFTSIEDFNLSSKASKFTAADTNEFSSTDKFVVTASSASIIGFTKAADASTATRSKVLDGVDIDLISASAAPSLQPLEWDNKRFVAGKVKTILGRVPMHEPWPQHENLDPTKVSPGQTRAQIPKEQ